MKRRTKLLAGPGGAALLVMGALTVHASIFAGCFAGRDPRLDAALVRATK